VEHLFEDQVAAANLLVVSKGDLIDEADQAKVSAQLKALTKDQTPVLMTNGKGAPLAAIFGLGLEDEAFARSQDYHHHHHHDDDDHDDDHDHDHGHDDFISTVVTIPEIDDHLAFVDRLKTEAKAHGLLRAKGFIKVKGKALPLVVQAVGARVDHYFGGSLEGDAGKLVLIGLKTINLDALSDALIG